MTGKSSRKRKAFGLRWFFFGLPICALLLAPIEECCSQEKRSDLTLGTSDYAFLLKVARSAAVEMMRSKETQPPPSVAPAGKMPREAIKCVYLSVFADGRPALRERGDRDTITEAVKVAGARAGVALRPFPHAEAVLERARLKIDIIEETDPLQRSSITRYMEVLDPGVDGISIRTVRGSLRILPTALLFAGPLAEKYIGDTLVKADRASLGGQLPIVRKMRTTCFIEERPGVGGVALFRGNVLLDKVTPDDMEKAALQAGLWLLSVQQKSGRFKYRTNPVLAYQDPTYNIVRHAGTCWSLLWLYRSTADEQFLNALKKGLDYTTRRTEHSAEPYRFAHVRFAEKSPLGATALTLLCMSEAMLCGAINADKQVMEDYANFIAYMQQDSGHFCKYLREAVQGTPPEEEPQYFPGEAMFALLQYYKLNPQKKWLGIVEKSAKLQIQRFEKDDFSDQWVMMALDELHRVTKKPEYAAACIKMADSILSKQHKPGEVPDPDYVGGFNHTNPPGMCSAATRMEGLVAAAQLAQKIGAPTDKYAQAVQPAARFIMQQQFRTVNSYMCVPQMPYIGAFHASPTDFELRIDYAQHAICALIGASRMAKAGK